MELVHILNGISALEKGILSENGKKVLLEAIRENEMEVSCCVSLAHIAKLLGERI